MKSVLIKGIRNTDGLDEYDVHFSMILFISLNTHQPPAWILRDQREARPVTSFDAVRRWQHNSM